MGLNEGGDSVLMSVLNKVKLELEVSINPDLPDKLKETVGPMM